MKQGLQKILLLLFLCGSAMAGPPAHEGPVIYAMSIVFAETPFSDIRPAGVVSKDEVGAKKHFEFLYDSLGRLVELSFKQKSKLIAFSDRFVRAPLTRFSYTANTETRIFYNEYAQRSLVSGNVYTSQFTLNKQGERASLKFLDLKGNLTENDFGIATYQWEELSPHSILEKRYNLQNELVRNRPEFQYMITRFDFDRRGLLQTMTNLGESGERITADEAGVVTTQLLYDDARYLLSWKNLDSLGKPVNGLTGMAEIKYKPSGYFAEQEASFWGPEGEPILTPWGVHRVVYEYDPFGNQTTRLFYDQKGERTQSRSGLSLLRMTWTDDGQHMSETAFFDKFDQRISIGKSTVHSYKVDFDINGNPIKTCFYSVGDSKTIYEGLGYFCEEVLFDKKGRKSGLRFLDKSEKLTLNNFLGLARICYTYNSMDELIDVQFLDENNIPVTMEWQASH